MKATRDEFVLARRPDWDELERILARDPRLASLPAATIARAAALFRSVATDLMRARAAGYAADLTSYLDALAARAHNALYSVPGRRSSPVWNLFARDFPRAVRRRIGLVALAAALFVLPGLGAFFAARASSDFAASILPAEMVESMEKAYAEGFEQGRDAGTDAAMAGFYVQNNVGIAFRCFATGILFGLGSVFFLIYNGVVTGAVAGMVARQGHGLNLLTFTCGHSPFELTAIVIAGAAGLLMGWALIERRGRTRMGSLRIHTRDLVVLVLGAAGMLLVAAAVEGFWSPSSVAADVKWGVAVVLAGLVTVYFAVGGRKGDLR